MRYFSVGPDELSGYELDCVREGYEWLVYSYEQWDYEGGGQAVALRSDGLLVVKDLGHCSCYGPMEEWETGSFTVTVDEFLREKDDIHDLTVMPEVEKKVRRLLFARMRK